MSRNRKSGRKIRYAVVGLGHLAQVAAMGIKLHVTVGERTITKRFPKRDQFAAELVYFSDCILKNREPEPSGLEGLADVRIARAIYESARTGRVVELPELPPKKRPTSQQEIHRAPHGKPKTVNVQSASGE